MSRPRLLPALSDVRVSHHDARQDTYGFIYLETPNYDGHDVRMGWIGGSYDPGKEDDESLHVVARYCPYVFTGNWGEPTYHQVVAAWDYAVKQGLPGFAEYAAERPHDVRWMNGDDFINADRFTLELTGNRERQTALKHRRGAPHTART